MNAAQRPVRWNPDHSRRIKAIPINIRAQVHVVRAVEGANAARVSIVSTRVIDIVVASHGIIGCADYAAQTVVQVLHSGVGDHAAPLVCIVKNLIDPKTDGVCVRLVEMRSHMIHGAERRARSCEPTGSSTSPSYHTATKTQFSPDLSLSNSIDCMCEKD